MTADAPILLEKTIVLLLICAKGQRVSAKEHVETGVGGNQRLLEPEMASVMLPALMASE